MDLIEAYRGTASLPFEAGRHGRIAVMIIDDRGIEKPEGDGDQVMTRPTKANGHRALAESIGCDTRTKEPKEEGTLA